MIQSVSLLTVQENGVLATHHSDCAYFSHDNRPFCSYARTDRNASSGPKVRTARASEVLSDIDRGSMFTWRVFIRKSSSTSIGNLPMLLVSHGNWILVTSIVVVAVLDIGKLPYSIHYLK